MNWKKWPYWVRGGVIFSMVGTTGALLTNFESDFFMLPVFPFILNVGLFISDKSPSSDDLLRENFVLTIDVLIGYFIIGSILGWLYGKIKSRKKI